MREVTLCRQAIGICCILASLSSAQAQEFTSNVLSSSFAQTPVAPNSVVSITFDKSLQLPASHIAVFYGNEDISMNFLLSSPDVLQGDFSLSPLSAGKQMLRIFMVTGDDQWIELAHLPLAIDSGKPVLTTKLTPSLVIGAKSQVYEKTQPDTALSGRTGYTDITLQAGLATDSSGEDWQVHSQTSVLGSSLRQEDVAYSMSGANANKIDIASYLVQATEHNRLGDASLAVGNVQYGNNPALVYQLGNRGVVLGQKFGSRVDLSFASQAGGMILGANNLLGIGDAGHRIDSVTLGTELLERANGLRVEFTHTNAVVRALEAPGMGMVPEAERSNGWGMRATSTSVDQDLRGELLYSVSNYTSAGDPSLSIAAGPTNKAATYMMNAGYDALRNVMWGSTPVSLTVGFRREHAGAGYRSLAAFYGADYLMDIASLNANFGVVNTSLQLNRREDNVDNLPGFLKNRVQGTTFNINTPLAQLVGSTQPIVWLPTLGYSFNRSHNFADTSFVPLGETVADLPDVLVTTHTLNLGWYVSPFIFGYAYSHNFQNTLQQLYATRDIRDVRHAINLTWMPSPQLFFSGAIDTTQSVQLDTGMARNSHNGQFSLNWIASPQYTLSGGMNIALSGDSFATQSQRFNQTQCQLTRNFEWTGYNNKKAPGQGYARFYRNVGEASYASFAPATLIKTGRTTLMLGINLTLF